ncbi:tetratricopeptide repeat protein [Flavobacterium sp.]|uniref:tetratricopeptide repeat protein n=1 Tax=Flavobacterium sp. TaxID=239 RepID=UPI0037BEB8AE
MNLSEYTYLLNNPNAVNEKQAKALETVVESFPYFQSARALYLKGLYNQDSYKYNFALKQTAAHTADRSVLFDFITSDEFTIIEKDIYEKKLALLMDIEVVESEIHHIEELVSEKTDEINAPEVSSIPVKPTVEFESSEIDFVRLENTPVIDEVSEEITLTEIVPTEIDEVITISAEEKTISESLVEEETEEEEPISIEISKENNEETISIDQNSFESSNKEIIPEIEEKLEIGKPIAFSQNEKHSFQEWLQLASFKPIERIEEKKETLSIQNSVQKEEKKQENTNNKLKKLEIIDKFIEANPKITPAKELVDLPSKPIETSDTTHLMTETLARVYLEQKKYSKAIQAYEILILKYPEKSIFFADRIKDIKILQQNNQ